jgi:hypothetical protein
MRPNQEAPQSIDRAPCAPCAPIHRSRPFEGEGSAPIRKRPKRTMRQWEAHKRTISARRYYYLVDGEPRKGNTIEKTLVWSGKCKLYTIG